MIFVIFGIFVIITVLCVICEQVTDSGWWTTLSTITGFCAVIALIAAIIIFINYSQVWVIEDKIQMYKEENTRIETQLSELVQQYMDYEAEIYGKLKGDSAVTLISLYPELKADTFVMKQAETYQENNNKIKILKEQKADAKLYKWWLCFGN